MVSRALEALIDRVLHPTPGNGTWGMLVAPEEAREAGAAAARLRGQCKPATLGEMMRWFAPVNVGVKNPQSEADFLAKCQAFLIACHDIPHPCLNVDTVREAMQKFTFFPAAAEVYALLLPYANPWHLRLYALEYIAKAPTSFEAWERLPSGRRYGSA
jgi:hypothetical protein